jgi:hypothetical protein
MDERQLERMQHHARRGKSQQLFQPPVLPLAVCVVAHQRKAKELKMHADLVRAACVQRRFDKRRRAQSFQHAITGSRFAPGVVAHRHAFAMRWMPRNGRADFSFVAWHFAADKRVIQFFNLAPGELIGQCDVRLIILGNDQAAAGVLVEPMHDPRPGHAADPA